MENREEYFGSDVMNFKQRNAVVVLSRYVVEGIV